jgi:hypothetical protein
MTANDKQPPESRKPAKEKRESAKDREARLAEALRQNLARRKAQGRARKTAGEAGPSDRDDGPD